MLLILQIMNRGSIVSMSRMSGGGGPGQSPNQGGWGQNSPYNNNRTPQSMNRSYTEAAPAAGYGNYQVCFSIDLCIFYCINLIWWSNNIFQYFYSGHISFFCKVSFVLSLHVNSETYCPLRWLSLVGLRVGGCYLIMGLYVNVGIAVKVFIVSHEFTNCLFCNSLIIDGDKQHKFPFFIIDFF